MVASLSGTWEEIEKHADDLRGKKVIVFLVNDFEAHGQPLQELSIQELHERREALDKFFEELDRLAGLPPAPIAWRADVDSFDDGLLDKYRKQGFKF